METARDDCVKEICHLKHKTGGWTGSQACLVALGDAMELQKEKKRKKKSSTIKVLMGSNLTPVKVSAGEGSTNREANCGAAIGSNYQSTGGPAAIT